MFEASSPILSAWDLAGAIAFLVVFPVYHFVYPVFARWRPTSTVRGQFDLLRESWVARLLERDQVLVAAQQTRNLTMVSSILVSSSLLLIGFVANMVVRVSEWVPDEALVGTPHDPSVVRFKLYCLLAVLGMAFSFFMAALRHLGNFVTLVGADPELLREQLGPPVEYLADLINRASHRYTLGVRSFYAATPILAWLVDARLFLLVGLAWGLKLMAFQDFSGKLSAVEDSKADSV